jgi:hypothetical protein
MFVPSASETVGISLDVKSGIMPLNGLRHHPVGGTSGWYIWAGEYSAADDFFKPLHANHLSGWLPAVEPYLALAPGWRFLIADDYQDVWFDKNLLVEN